jgi:hypothetical protein
MIDAGERAPAEAKIAMTTNSRVMTPPPSDSFAGELS